MQYNAQSFTLASICALYNCIFIPFQEFSPGTLPASDPGHAYSVEPPLQGVSREL